MPKSLVDYLPPPIYKLHTEDPLEVYDVLLGRLIAESPIMMFDLLRNMKRKLMSRVEFVLFFPTSIARDCVSYTFAVII